MDAKSSVQAVFFDVGETLVDETRYWAGWADWIGVPSSTLLGVLGSVIERGLPQRAAFAELRPGFDYSQERSRRISAGHMTQHDRSDLYEDALPCLKELKQRGYLVGVAGNQPIETEKLFRGRAFAVDVVTSSASIGHPKPHAAFFANMCRVARVPASQLAYVGDRIDNDVEPANAAGMTSVFIKRGMFGYIHAHQGRTKSADITIEALHELPDALDQVPDQ